MQNQPLSTGYDVVPYPSFSHPLSHPDHLSTLATLFGMEPAPVDRCRVLEIGCASGGNLIPMAVGLPGSEFIGIDLSERQVVAGQAVVEDLGLKNIDLRHLSLLDVAPDLGRFDYVIAHGVYSWVPAPVRDKLLFICREQLTPNGITYVSYNTYPGWHTRGVVRDMMRYHTRRLDDPKTVVDQARALLTFLAKSVPVEGGVYGAMIRQEENALRDKSAASLLHDELEEVNEPVYFHQFIGEAERAGLQFLCEADVSSTFGLQLPPGVSTELAKMGNDPLVQEQYLDFLTNRKFRQTLLCHQKVHLRRQP